jgi:aromatic ring-opening dioxygenase LigB subunit
MPINLAAIVPHPIVLVPSIGKDNLSRLEKTENFYQKISEALKQEKINSIFLISSHGKIEKDFFVFNAAKDFKINFEEFGDFLSSASIGGDLELTQSLRERLEEDSPIKTINEEVLDFGGGVPLYRFCLEKETEVSPFHISGLPLAEHFAIGEKIGQMLAVKNKKIAVIASGDLSHRLAKNSPAGFSPRAAKFDQRLIELLQNKKIEEIINLDQAQIVDAKPCGLKSIIVLLGILTGAEIDWGMENFVYESPFGVGYLTTSLNIKNPT